MTFRFFYKALKSFAQTNGRERDPLGTPSISIRSSHDFQSFQHLVQIIQRLAHAHHHHVGQFIPLGKRIYLIDYLIGCQVGTEALLTRHTEFTVHLTSHLRRYAKCGTIFIGNINRLYKVLITCPIQVFHRTVCGTHSFHRCLRSYFVDIFQEIPMFQRQVGHIVYGVHFLVIQP